MFVDARRSPCQSYPLIQLTVEPTPVSRPPRCRSLGGLAADGNRGNCWAVPRGRRRWPTVVLLSTEATVSTCHGVLRRGHWSSRVVAERIRRRSFLPRVHSRPDRRTVERGYRGRDAAVLSRRLKRRPAVAWRQSRRRERRTPLSSRNCCRAGLDTVRPTDCLDPRRTPRGLPVRRRGRPPAFDTYRSPLPLPLPPLLALLLYLPMGDHSLFMFWKVIFLFVCAYYWP